MKIVFLLIALTVLGFSESVFGQTTQPPGNPPRSGSNINILERRAMEQAELQKREAEIQSRLSREKSQNNKNSLFAKPKRSKEQEKQLLPSLEDLNKYSAFLQQPKTGLIRLYLDKGCQSNLNVVRAAEKCSAYIPGSSFYSFREREYTLEGLSDIRYKNGLLISDPLAGQGIFVMLGDIALEDVSLESKGMKFLVEYSPAINKEEALKQYSQISDGVVADKYLYRNSVSIGENITYALRVIAYRGDFLRTVLEGDDRKDIILAFRIVRNENDDITLLWKELARKEAPKITDLKNAQKSN
jgi:hypothetical protein